MSSYIGLMFKYLFEPDSPLPAELLAESGRALANSSLGAPPPSGPSQASSSSNLIPLAPANANEVGLSSPSLIASVGAGDNLPLTSSALGGASSSILNKSPQSSLWSTWFWSQQSAGGANFGPTSKLRPSKCLGFARLFAMAQNSSSSNNNNNNDSSNGTTTTTSSTLTSASGQPMSQLSSASSGQPNRLAIRLGSFAEFEHLIRQQLASLFGSLQSTSANNNNSDDNNNSHWHRTIANLTGGGSSTRNLNNNYIHSPASSSSFSTSTPDSFIHSHQQRHQLDAATTLHANSTTDPSNVGGSLMRLLIRSIGGPAAELLGPSEQQQQPLERDTTSTVMMVSAGHDDDVRQEEYHALSWQQQRPSNAWAQEIADSIQLEHQMSLMPASSDSSPQNAVSSLELLECYNQLQLSDYYKQYDIFIGLRIASTLSILFIVFILFVIYKTGCRDGERTSRSQLRLTSAAATATAAATCTLTSTSKANKVADQQTRTNASHEKARPKQARLWNSGGGPATTTGTGNENVGKSALSALSHNNSSTAGSRKAPDCTNMATQSQTHAARARLPVQSSGQNRLIKQQSHAANAAEPKRDSVLVVVQADFDTQSVCHPRQQQQQQQQPINKTEMSCDDKRPPQPQHQHHHDQERQQRRDETRKWPGTAATKHRHQNT